MLNANATFLLVMAGLLAIFWELARPRFVFPGILGAGALAVGVYFSGERSPQVPGVVGLAAAAVLLAFEFVHEMYFVGGILGTAALAYGFCRLFGQPGGIDYRLAISLSLIFGAAVTWLARCARRARWNKMADV